MAGKTLQVKVPMWTANLLPNLLGVASLAAICTFVALLTDYRWGGLLAGGFGLALTVWMQWSAAPALVDEVGAAPDNVEPIRKAS